MSCETNATSVSIAQGVCSSGAVLNTYSVEVDEVTLVLGATVQGAVMASELLPGSMEIIGHDVDEVQLPDGE